MRAFDRNIKNWISSDSQGRIVDGDRLSRVRIPTAPLAGFVLPCHCHPRGVELNG